MRVRTGRFRLFGNYRENETGFNTPPNVFNDLAGQARGFCSRFHGNSQRAEKSPFDGDTTYWVNRMNKKYDGIRRHLIKSQDTNCPICNLQLRITDEIQF